MMVNTPNLKSFIFSFLFLISTAGFAMNLNPEKSTKRSTEMHTNTENTTSCMPVFIINELDADTAGTDTLEFVEIYDGGVGNSSLDGLVLVFYNGSNNLSYNAFDLDGFTTDANGYFVIGNAAVANVSIVIPSNGLQNGADAAALYTANGADFPNGSAVTTTNLVDAIVYDTNDSDDAELLVLLNPGEPQVNEGGAGDKDGHSSQRIPNGSGGARNTTTYTQIPPTPGAENMAPVAAPDFIINELDADTAGTDTMEFVELYDGGVGNSSLDGFTLVFYNGSNNQSYAAYDLDGETTNADGFFVIGNAAVPNVSVVFGSNGLQNGADAVGLYMDDATNFPNGTAVTTTNLVDALVYDTNDGDDAELLPLLNPGEPQINEDGAGDKDGHSLQRYLNGTGGPRNTSTYVQAIPTPGAINTNATMPVTLVINEVDADTQGTDTMEFIELYDGGAGNSSLDGFVVVLYNGSSDTSYNAIDLDGFTTDANGYFVIGNAAVANVSVVFPSNGVQNGADAVTLYTDDATNFPNGTAVTTTNLIDAIVYDTNDGDDAGLLILLNAGQAQINEGELGDKDGHSNQRIPNGAGGARNTATYTQIPPTPGAANGSMLPILLSEIAVTPTAGEFIEIYNPNTFPVDLTDVYITDATFAGGSVYYYNIVTGANAGGGGFGDFLARFPAGAMIAGGEYQTLAIAGSTDYNATYGIDPTYELYEDDGVADAIPDMLEGLPGSINNQGGLTNGGEVAILFSWDGQSDLVQDLDYLVWGDKAEAVDKTGVAIDGPDADATTSTYANDTPIANQEVVAAGSHPSGESWQREDQTEGTETDAGGNGANGDDETSENLGTTWCTSDTTAGLQNVCDPIVVTTSFIHEVQGSGLTAALAGSTVRVEAIVTGDFQNTDQLGGFFIQEEDADADVDASTSEGIFVYCNTCPTDVAVGDAVDVTGLAVDFFGMTQIDVTTAGGNSTVLSSGNTLPTPTNIVLPASASTEAEGTFESTEGMLINVTTTLAVSEYFELARYGQLVLSANNRIEQFTDTNAPDPAGYAAFLTQLDQSRIILDDDNNIQSDAITGAPDEPYFWPRPGASNTNAIRGGDEITNLQGIMHWSFAGQNGTDAWRIRPVEEAFTYNFTTVNPRTATPDDVGGAFKVGSFNVLNYFTTLNERGANSIAELDRQRTKIAAAICELNADVVGLIEIENNGVTAINDLLNGTGGINTVCGSTYAAVDAGIIGTDEISVAFIYNTATVSLDGAFAILDSSVDPLFNDDKNRPVLAQTFMQISNGGKITVAVNHLKSKGSPCDDVGDFDLNDGAANCNQTRTDAATALVNWLATDPTSSGDEDFMIIGDLNAYSKETPIDAIKAGADGTGGTTDDYVDLLESFVGPSAYSFVFDGQLGYLDYALASQNLVGQLTGATAWHINADEANIYDYNDGIQDPSEASFQRKSNALPIYEANAFRASDHDPIVVGINLSGPPVITCPASFIVDNDAGFCAAIVNFPDAVASDPDGDLVSVIQTAGLASGSTFPVGISTIEYTATDAAGNITTCTFTITVEDNEPPAVVCQDITIQLDAFGDASITASDIDGGTTDNCGISTITASPVDFTCTDVGANNVTLTVTDINGNSSTCIAVVTVEDITAPSVVCQDITVQLDATGSVTIDPASLDGGSTDGCGGALSYAIDIDTFGCDDIGTNNVILTVTDPSGNSDTCMAVVTVEDMVAPTLVCMDITVALDANGTASIVANDVITTFDDACGVGTAAIDIDTFDCDDIGTPVTVTVLASDANGNSSSCTAIVTVIDDLAPVLTCPTDQTMAIDNGTQYMVPDYFVTGEASAVDNCTDPLTMTTQDPAAGTLLDPGTYTATITAEDDFGNEATCTFELTVDELLGVSDTNKNLSNIALYPNPAQEYITISNPNNVAIDRAMIYDISGRLVKNVDLQNSGVETSINITELASATYMIVLKSDTEQIAKQLVKE